MITVPTVDGLFECVVCCRLHCAFGLGWCHGVLDVVIHWWFGIYISIYSDLLCVCVCGFVSVFSDTAASKKEAKQR